MENPVNDSGGPSSDAGSDRSSPTISTRALEEAYVYQALENRRRRFLLDELAYTAGTSVQELARAVARREDERQQAECPEPVVQDVRLSLIHNHLPKLDEWDIVEYDRSAMTVQPGPKLNVVISALHGVTMAIGAE